MFFSNIAMDPHFGNAASGHFRLRPDSPCIYACSSDLVSITAHLAGTPRIIGENFGMGAYELGPSALFVLVSGFALAAEGLRIFWFGSGVGSMLQCSVSLNPPNWQEARVRRLRTAPQCRRLTRQGLTGSGEAQARPIRFRHLPRVLSSVAFDVPGGDVQDQVSVRDRTARGVRRHRRRPDLNPRPGRSGPGAAPLPAQGIPPEFVQDPAAGGPRDQQRLGQAWEDSSNHLMGHASLGTEASPCGFHPPIQASDNALSV